MATGEPTTEPTVDVAIVGAGPAGRWLAALVARRGLSVALVDPRLDAPWPNNYGVWLDEIIGLPIDVPLSHRWNDVVVHLRSRTTLDRTYGRIDNPAFRRRLDRIADGGEIIRLESAVTDVRPTPDGCVVATGDGRRAGARLAVDASGSGALLDYPGEPTPAYQRAFGIFARFRDDPLAGDPMVLMDYRPVDDRPAADAHPPSFLYGMHLGDDRYFVEETVLVGREPTPFSVLRDRLDRRLRRRNAEPIDVRDRERCHIPMGTPLPEPEPPVVGFGAAAGLVHPATGYQMGRMLRAGPPLADALAAGCTRGWSTDRLCHRAHQTLWPAELRHARRLLVFGRDVLLELDADETRRFFETFFSLSDQKWRDYLRGDVDNRRICAVMGSLFARADLPLRLRLIRRGLGDIRRLLGALSPADLPRPAPAQGTPPP